MPKAVVETRFACDFPGCNKTHATPEDAEECQRKDAALALSVNVKAEIAAHHEAIRILRAQCPHGGATFGMYAAFHCEFCGYNQEECDPSR